MLSQILELLNYGRITALSKRDQKVIYDAYQKVQEGEELTEEEVIQADTAFSQWKATGIAADIALQEGTEAMGNIMQEIYDYQNIVAADGVPRKLQYNPETQRYDFVDR